MSGQNEVMEIAEAVQMPIYDAQACAAPPNTELTVAIRRSHNHAQGQLFLDESIPLSIEASNSELIELRRRIFQVVSTWEKWREKE